MTCFDVTASSVTYKGEGRRRRNHYVLCQGRGVVGLETKLSSSIIVLCRVAIVVIVTVLKLNLLFSSICVSGCLLFHLSRVCFFIKSVYALVVHSAGKSCQLLTSLAGLTLVCFLLPLVSLAPRFKAPVVPP